MNTDISGIKINEPRKLMPANPELKKKLPHFSKQASAMPWADNEVNAVYPHALEICGANSSLKGLGVFMGFAAIPFIIFLFVIGLEIAADGDLFGLVPLFAGFTLLIPTTIFLRMDFFTYRDEPILLNRHTRKVHIFHIKRNWRRPFSQWPLCIDTYDWDCVHGEIGGGVVSGTVPLLRYRLYVAFTESPKSKRVVDRIKFGGVSNEQTSLVQLWEHIRRYMEVDGPPLQAKDRLHANRKFSSRATWGEAFPWVRPNWRQEIESHPILTVASILLFPPFFVLTLTAWISGITGRDPFWPRDILQAAGGAPLSEAEIEKLRPESTATGPAPIEEDPTGGMKPRELAKYQKELRGRYAEMRDDELEDLVQNATLLAPARRVLAEEMQKRGISTTA